MDFTEEQKRYLEGFAAGSGIALRGASTPAPAAASDGDPNVPQLCRDAQAATIAAGRKLTNEEQAKRKRFPLDQWDDVVRHARDNVPPKGTDVLAFKYQGLFWVAPAQESFMTRLRFAGGITTAAQFRGIATLADKYAGGYSDVTTRANLQLREIAPANAATVIEGLHDLGVINRGSGADNIRNVTGSPTAGIDPDELFDVRPLCRAMHHYILNHREMYGLPRKFNIAFDGGGSVSALEDTNDIGFTAVRVSGQRPADPAAAPAVEPGVYFRLTLGGITGHKDFARDTGYLCTPDECVPVAAAVVRAFIQHGDRTDRRKARLKYVLDRMGFDGFMAEVKKHLPPGLSLRAFPLDQCDPRPPVTKDGHVGFHAQRQPGLYYAGVVLPVGRLTSDQMRGVARVADAYGSGTIRLTVWQNLIVSDIPAEHVPAVKIELRKLGLDYTGSNLRAGLVACTGSAGCKYAAADTKRHALAVAAHVEATVPELDQPVNVHLTGCHHSCAQHYIGDVGCQATKVGDDAAEGYHVYVGGGYGADRAIARELLRDVLATDLPHVVERLLRAYLDDRRLDESFKAYVERTPTEELKAIAAGQSLAA